MSLRKIKRGNKDNIYDYKDGTLWVQVSRNIAGKNHTRQKYGLATLGDARRVRDELDNELYEFALAKQSGMPTWENALKEYLSFCEKTQAASTVYTKGKILRADTKEWGDITIDSIRPEMIELRITEATIGKSVDSKINLLKFINGVFKHAISQGANLQNPCTRLHKIHKPKRKKLVAMTRGEIKTLLDGAKRMEHEWYSIYYLMYQLGLRSGEGIALTWEDIDLDDNSLVISKSYCSKSKKTKTPKNGEPRTVTFNDEVKNFLKGLKSQNPSSIYVLPRLKKWLRGEAAEVLRALQRDLGIKETNFHSIRASYITHLLLAGESVTKVQKLVGHKELATTELYVRIAASDLKGATNSLAIYSD